MKYTKMTSALYAYLVVHGHNHDPVLDALREETTRLGGISRMQIAPEQGTLLSILVRAIGARSAVEIGTFTGHSAICIARGLAPGGRLLCCDTSEEWTSIARRYFEKAGVADRIALRIGPAIETLRALGPDERLDFAFIDADKCSYRAYYEALLPRVRSNGLLVLDNVLWSGSVINPTDREEDTEAIRAMNDFIATDRRVQAVMLAVSDGITIVRKREPGEIGG